ncbi:MAG TPA: hypothetical protein VNG13_16215 [Mycobacteriales bacterium]|nr:hypothetical protein [Mycobacteriales bacterium]
MTPRRSRRREPPASSPPTTPEVVEEGADGDWVVRRLAGRAGRTYRCPGCDQEFSSTLPHVVVWPASGAFAGSESRRHWHTVCWQRRDRRGVKDHRSKNAPRFG